MKKYNVIYADPAWAYRNKKTGGSMKSGAASHYPTMTVEEICNLPIKDIAAKDCILFLWVTVPLLPEVLEPVLKAWGFKYKTAIFWHKIMSLGLGFWFRGQVEILIVATSGKVKATRMQIPNIHRCKAEKHSKKPAYFRNLIEQASDKLGFKDKVELFARENHHGWDAWGNQVEDSIDLPTLLEPAYVDVLGKYLKTNPNHKVNEDLIEFVDSHGASKYK